MTKGISIEEAKIQMREKIKKAMEESMMELQAEIALATPVLTGNLRRSITNKVSEEDGNIVGEVGSWGIIYAHAVDQKVPYLESTVDSNLERIRQKFKEMSSND